MLIKILFLVLAMVVTNVQSLLFKEELHKAHEVVNKLPDLTEQDKLVRLRQQVKDLKLSLNRVKTCMLLFQSGLQADDVDIPKRYEIYTTQMKNIIVDMARAYQKLNPECIAGSKRNDCAGYKRLLGENVTQWLIQQKRARKRLSDEYSEAYKEIVSNTKPFDGKQVGFLFKIVQGVEHVSQRADVGNIATEVNNLVNVLRSSAI